MNNSSQLHSGHRARMRQRFLENGLKGFADHEVLEMLLYAVIPRSNTNPIAHSLLDRFGSLSAVLSAKPEALMQIEGIGEQSAVFLSLVGQLPQRLSQNAFGVKPVLDKIGEAKQYCIALMQGRQTEGVYVICLDAQHQVIRAVLAQEGTIDQTPLYPRQVIEIALHHNAHSILLAHNHPSGSLHPSLADQQATENIRVALSAISIPLLDHIIVGNQEAVSLRQALAAEEEKQIAQQVSQAAESPKLRRRSKA